MIGQIPVSICWAASLYLVCLGAEQTQAKVVVFRNDANTPIRFSLREVTASEPVTQELRVGGRVQFDLPENGRFDFCGTGLDRLNGTFGATNIDLPRLLANAQGNEIGVDGTIKQFERREGGRPVTRAIRTAILLVFPSANQGQVVVTATRVCADYANTFYHCPIPRCPSANPASPIKPLGELATATHSAQDEFRIWTNLEGDRTAVARLVLIKDLAAFFECDDGKRRRSPISRLSQSDQQWIERWQASNKHAIASTTPLAR